MFRGRPSGTDPCPNSYAMVAGKVRRMCLNGKIIRDWETGLYVDLIDDDIDDDGNEIEYVLGPWQPPCERCNRLGYVLNHPIGEPAKSPDCIQAFGLQFWRTNTERRWRRKLARVKEMTEQRLSSEPPFAVG